jgi:hypothetical protein
VPAVDLDYLDASRGEDGVERGGELRVPVPDQEPKVIRPRVEVHDQVAGLLGHPHPGGVGRDPREVDPPLLNLDDEEP